MLCSQRKVQFFANGRAMRINPAFALYVSGLRSLSRLRSLHSLSHTVQAPAAKPRSLSRSPLPGTAPCVRVVVAASILLVVVPVGTRAGRGCSNSPNKAQPLSQAHKQHAHPSQPRPLSLAPYLQSFLGMSTSIYASVYWALFTNDATASAPAHAAALPPAPHKVSCVRVC